MSKITLRVEDLSVEIDGKSGYQTVVDRLSFSINAGEGIGLVGESGCGKTMTALAILGLLSAPGLKLEAGVIEVNGQDMTGLTVAQQRSILGRDIAMVFQQPGRALDPVFTLGQQIGSVYRRHLGGDRASIRRASLDSLSQVGFKEPEKIAGAYPHQLSGGMRQLAMIAMATVCKPAVLIADEPTTALDSATRALILEQIRRLQSDHNTSILMISHDLSVIRHSCQKVMVMYCGRIIEKSDCNTLFTHPRHPYSNGLMACIPQISATHHAAVSAIPGQVPAAGKLPSGCHFAPRCSRAVAQCTRTAPQLETDEVGSLACFRPL